MINFPYEKKLDYLINEFELDNLPTYQYVELINLLIRFRADIKDDEKYTIIQNMEA